ncbi:MAG TPA: POTRA domain-containing protein, partial [Planctomycetaceae bacterium]|nr:POTRA domain-containing protein [Planctomycetaceae bacterium]
TADIKQRSGEFYNSRLMNKDVEEIKNRYGKLGRTFASVEPIPRFLEEPGTMDLVYQVNEDRVWTIRHVNVHIGGDNPHTREAAVRHRVLTHPGDLADPKKINQSKRRLEGQLFERAGPEAPRVNISKVEEKTTPNRQQFAQAGGTIRGQNPDGATTTSAVATAPFLLAQADPATHPFGGDATDPLLLEPPPGQLDIEYGVTETQTGSLSFGVGVNSNSGVVGSIVLQENNFDITRLPRSFDDFRNGTAFRGGGQQFRIEAVPGNVVSRYLASWTDPYFLDTDYSVGVSGFYFNRFYRDWQESRLGGRINAGKQVTHEFSILGSVRAESVDLTRPTVPTPAILQRALGNTFLSTGRIGVAHDTRDSQFLPAEGHYLTA